MGWLSRLTGDLQPQIWGKDIFLRAPRAEDFEQWRDLRQASQSFLVPWEPKWSADELSPTAYSLRLRVQRNASRDGTARPFFIFAAKSSALLGGINITNIRRGVAQSGTLGYWIGERHADSGYMGQALSALIEHAHCELKLHRLEAACLPRNTPSIRLLARAGFEQEGLARAYLKINDQWEDHLLWGRVLAPAE